MELFKLLGKVIIDNGEANKGLDETADKGEKTESKLSKVFGGIGKGAAVVGKAVATGLAAGGAAMGTLMVKSLNMAGELEQNMGGSEAVFKEYATSVQNTAKEAYANMGLSTSEYLATANKMGALFQGAGFSIEESMNLSSGAMQRAADVASIMGIDTEAAMEAIAGAAKGNFTMMDNLGVAMNDTTLQAYAMSKGINKSTSEMTNQEKIGLAMEMFMEKTAYAAGNYAKENETLAGSLGTAKAALTNFLDGSGDVDQLVTAFSNCANVIVKNLETLAPRLISGITDIINKIMPKLPPLLQKILPVIIEGAVSLINGLVAALPTVIDALMNALPALIEGVQQIINALIQALPQIMEALVQALPTLIPMLVDALVSMIVTLCTMMPEIIQPLIDYLPEIIVAIVDAILQNIPALLDAGGQLLMGLIEGMDNLIGKIPEILKVIWDAIVNGIKTLFGIHSPSTVMAEIGGFIMQGLIDGINRLVNNLKAIWTNIKNFISNVWDAVKSKTQTVMNNIKSVVSNVWNAIKSAISTAVNTIKTAVTNAFNAVKSTVTNIFNSVKSTVSNVWNNIKTNISNTVNGIKSTVTTKFEEIKSKITKPIQDAKSTIDGIVAKLKTIFKFEWSLPKLKLPHISVKGGKSPYGIGGKGSLPSFSIEWYKKAMDAPMVLRDATIFGYNPATGSLMGGGEAGPEVISGLGSLLNMIRSAVAAENNMLAYYMQKVVEILADYFPQFLDKMGEVPVWDTGVAAAQLAPAMNKNLAILRKQEERGR